MSSLSLVNAEYTGHLISFDEGAWFNATQAAANYGKRPIDWLKQKDTKEYIDLLCQFHKVTQNHFIKTRKGKNVGGTWFHPKIAIPFARWPGKKKPDKIYRVRWPKNKRPQNEG